MSVAHGYDEWNFGNRRYNKTPTKVLIPNRVAYELSLRLSSVSGSIVVAAFDAVVV